MGKSNIKYICVSDLHFGDNDSLFTPFSTPSTQSFHLCLKKLIDSECRDKPSLILCGDIIELALASPSKSLHVFEQFLTEVGQMFSNIIYIPGNHDHHLWESAREDQYEQYIRERAPGGSQFESPWHHTYMLAPTPLPIGIIESFCKRNDALKSLKINCVYPNLGFFNAQRCVTISHGHYTESKYSLGSWLKQKLIRLPPPRDIDQLEEENFAWIDFLWSTLRQTGTLGQGVETMYEVYLSPRGPITLIYNLVKNLIDRPVIGSTLGTLAALVAILVSCFFDVMFERHRPGAKNATSDSTEADHSSKNHTMDMYVRLTHVA